MPFALLLACYLIFVRWAPENQVARRQAAFIAAIDEADFSTYSGLISTNYTDRWGFTHQTVIQGLRDIARQFISLEAEYTPVSQEPDGDGWIVTGAVRIGGRGNAIAQEVISRSRREKEPFSFHWIKESWKPWDWKLERIDHPSLAVPRRSATGQEFFDVY